MSIFQIIYLSLLFSSFIISIVTKKHHPSFKIFPYLLGFSLLTEIVVSILYYVFHHGESSFYTIYHIYVPIEYAFLAYFFYLVHAKKSLKNIIFFSIPIFTVLSIFFSISREYFHKYPGINANLEALLLIIWSMYTLLTLEPDENFAIPLLQLPLFWICTGILGFELGMFMYNGAVNFILEEYPEVKNILNYTITKSLNYYLYISFSIGFLCSNHWKKYI